MEKTAYIIQYDKESNIEHIIETVAIERHWKVESMDAYIHLIYSILPEDDIVRMLGDAFVYKALN